MLVGKMLATAMLLREESRGTHYSEDFPNRSDKWTQRIVMKQGKEQQIVVATQRVE